MRFRDAILLAAAVLAARAFLLPIWPMPVPTIYDEFSYLLQADTFAHGRLANPQHPKWEFFESIYVLQRPSSASRYPPGQALAMAAGQAVFGHPWFGVWLSCGLLAAALLWAMAAWVRGPWLWAGAGLIFQLCFFSHWMNSYWGGAVAATGGALVIGGFARSAQWPMGIGAVLVILTRPFEGMLLLIAIGIALRGRFRTPIVVCGVLGAAWLGYYHYRVTGSPLRLPYQEYFSQYEIVPPFNVLPLGRAEPLRHLDFEWLDRGWAMDAWNKARSLGFPLQRLHDWFEALRMLLGSALWIIPLAGFAPRLWKAAETRLLCLLALVMFAASFTEVTFFPHYAAPFAAVFLILAVLGMRQVGSLYPAIALLVLMFGQDAWQIARRATPDHFHAVNARRQPIERDLEARAPNRHVIFVRYTVAKNPHEEWIYNRADIDSAPVIWAQDMGEEKNRELLAYYPDRKFWLFQPDESLTELANYP